LTHESNNFSNFYSTFPFTMHSWNASEADIGVNPTAYKVKALKIVRLL